MKRKISRDLLDNICSNKYSSYTFRIIFYFALKKLFFVKSYIDIYTKVFKR